MLIPFSEMAHYQLDMTSVFHIGGSEGEEFEAYEQCGVKRVLWVEPRKAAADVLRRKSSKQMQSVVATCAAGNESKNVSLHVANNGQSSSVLQPHTHLQEHPHVTFPSMETVPCLKTSELWSRYRIQTEIPTFVNIDVQGAELDVITGMTFMLNEIEAIYTEVNIRELYAGCAKLQEIDEYLRHTHMRVDTRMTPHGWGDALYIHHRKLKSIWG